MFFCYEKPAPLSTLRSHDGPQSTLLGQLLQEDACRRFRRSRGQWQESEGRNFGTEVTLMTDDINITLVLKAAESLQVRLLECIALTNCIHNVIHVGLICTFMKKVFVIMV